MSEMILPMAFAVRDRKPTETRFQISNSMLHLSSVQRSTKCDVQKKFGLVPDWLANIKIDFPSNSSQRKNRLACSRDARLNQMVVGLIKPGFYRHVSSVDKLNDR